MAKALNSLPCRDAFVLFRSSVCGEWNNAIGFNSHFAA
jgi:hypothetical protein